MKREIPKQLAEKYSIEIEDNWVIINNPDGLHKSCISMPIDVYFKIENDKEEWTIWCEEAVLTLQKHNHSTHLTIFS